jgi:predicted DNA-binding transcriptional regulator AlpA
MDFLLLSAQDAAKLLGIGRSHFYGLHSSGRLGPLPVKLGRRAL